MDSAKKQLADRLKSANNILVTVSRDPSVDQLAACLGLTLLLNKLNKHSVAVFSGQVPSTIEFLKPEETIEKTTDSLRDFIIALDKDKADKLRYKVEDNVVRIFITPYKTSITEEDLEFSQGDFNVDVVIALGVKKQEDLDQAITAHGRILHDATVASINLSQDAELGTINWYDPQASSLSELVTDLAKMLGDNLFDNQIATALLTGIVAETDRFSNDKTSSQTMNASSTLMAAGANQQLVASKLEEPEKSKPAAQPSAGKPDSGKKSKKDGKAGSDPSLLSISHDDAEDKAEKPEKTDSAAPPAMPEPPKPPTPQLPQPQLQPPRPQSSFQPGAKLLTDAPSLGGTLSANTKPEGLDPVTDPMSMPQVEPNQLLDHQPAATSPIPPPPPPVSMPAPAPPAPMPMSAPTSLPPSAPAAPLQPAPKPMPTPFPPADNGKETLTQIEKSVNSPHVDPNQLDAARNEVNQALQDSIDPTPSPIQALSAKPMGGKLHPDGMPPVIQSSASPVLPMGGTPPESSDTSPQPSPSNDSLSPDPRIANSAAAPPVAPPLPQEAINNAKNKTPGLPPAL